MQQRDLIPCCIMQWGDKLQFKYLHEFESKFEKNLGCESGSKVGTFDEKNVGGKSRATVPLNQEL
jgi:hypothetical protein